MTRSPLLIMPNPNVTKEGVEVKAGQVWRDLDKRMGGRTVTVIFAKFGVARVKGGESWSRQTELSIRRMHRHSTGWELVSGVPTPRGNHFAGAGKVVGGRLAAKTGAA